MMVGLLALAGWNLGNMKEVDIFPWFAVRPDSFQLQLCHIGCRSRYLQRQSERAEDDRCQFLCGGRNLRRGRRIDNYSARRSGNLFEVSPARTRLVIIKDQSENGRPRECRNSDAVASAE